MPPVPPNACRGKRHRVLGGSHQIRFVLLPGGAVAKRTVRATTVIFDTPAFQDNARFVQIAEEFVVVQTLRTLS
jgi:hypothetical protein